MKEYKGQYKAIKPSGVLTVSGKEYFLLQPYPTKTGNDSWQLENERRFAVVPKESVIGYINVKTSELGAKSGDPVYSYARHLITNAPWIIEYVEIHKQIFIRVLDEDDLYEDDTIYPTPEPPDTFSCLDDETFFLKNP